MHGATDSWFIERQYAEAEKLTMSSQQSLLQVVLKQLGKIPCQLLVSGVCYSEGIRTVAFQLGIDHVIAVNADVGMYDVLGRSFCSGFYQALAQGATIKESCQKGENEVTDKCANVKDYQNQGQETMFKYYARRSMLKKTSIFKKLAVEYKQNNIIVENNLNQEIHPQLRDYSLHLYTVTTDMRQKMVEIYHDCQIVWTENQNIPMMIFIINICNSIELTQLFIKQLLNYVAERDTRVNSNYVEYDFQSGNNDLDISINKRSEKYLFLSIFSYQMDLQNELIALLEGKTLEKKWWRMFIANCQHKDSKIQQIKQCANNKDTIVRDISYWPIRQKI